MVKIKTTGKYNITYKNIQYDFDSGVEYTVDEDTAKMLVEGSFANYAEEIKNETKSKKTNANIK